MQELDSVDNVIYNKVVWDISESILLLGLSCLVLHLLLGLSCVCFAGCLAAAIVNCLKES